jgi:hypothetical protein
MLCYNVCIEFVCAPINGGWHFKILKNILKYMFDIILNRPRPFKSSI